MPCLPQVLDYPEVGFPETPTLALFATPARAKKKTFHNFVNKNDTQAIADLAVSLKGTDAADKVAELQKLDR
jgi:hypothetical protein